jgi:DNA-binding transcriptional LysR family regulator
MDSISRISVFAEVVEQGSFIGAGRSLGLSGPAVSKQIQNLEAELGVQLLVRTTRQVSTTEEGQRYYERVAKVLADLDEAEAEVQESNACPAGKIKVNVPMSFGIKYLAQPIAEFARRYPQVEMEVDYSDRWVDVIGDGYDLVIRIAALRDSGLIARKLGSCPILLCASPEFIDRFYLPETPQQLAGLPAVVYTQHAQSEEWRYRKVAADTTGSIKLQRVFAANSGEQQVAACRAGVGIALLPIFLIAEELEAGTLVHLLPEFETVPVRNVYGMYAPNRFLPTRVRLLLDWLVECSQEYSW